MMAIDTMQNRKGDFQIDPSSVFLLTIRNKNNGCSGILVAFGVKVSSIITLRRSYILLITMVFMNEST